MRIAARFRPIALLTLNFFMALSWCWTVATKSIPNFRAACLVERPEAMSVTTFISRTVSDDGGVMQVSDAEMRPEGLEVHGFTGSPSKKPANTPGSEPKPRNSRPQQQ